MPRLSPPLMTTLIYGVFGTLWILFSDRLLETMINDLHLLSRLQTYKGTAYVVITSLLLYLLMNRDYQRILAEQEERRRIFYTTMRAVQHILNNFLQNMSLFRHEAKATSGFRPEVVTLYEQVIDATSNEIIKLSSLDEPSSAEIHRTVYPK